MRRRLAALHVVLVSSSSGETVALVISMTVLEANILKNVVN